MAAIVASLLYWAAWIVVAVSCALVGASAQSFLTFGGALGIVSGMLAWWLVAFAIALPYAACVFPWEEDPWPKKK